MSKRYLQVITILFTSLYLTGCVPPATLPPLPTSTPTAAQTATATSEATATTTPTESPLPAEQKQAIVDMNNALHAIWTVDEKGNLTAKNGTDLKAAGFGYDLKTGVLTRTYFSELLQENLTEPITKGQLSVEFVKDKGYTDKIDFPACAWDGKECQKEYAVAKVRGGGEIKEEMHSIYEIMLRQKMDMDEIVRIKGDQELSDNSDTRADSAKRLNKVLPYYTSDGEKFVSIMGKDIQASIGFDGYFRFNDNKIYKMNINGTFNEIPTPQYNVTAFGENGEYGFIKWEAPDGTMRELIIDRPRINNFKFDYSLENPVSVRTNPFMLQNGWE
jgi:hypothetical protein